ncbi:hypothetical protein WMY93_023611 [Mugilogobius chulae]|uniref:Uncharacterized protein n=1 Tax=Mugilogobius chulae TaxID=88201 RepID=A0AAW0N9T0_9GOBI
MEALDLTDGVYCQGTIHERDQAETRKAIETTAITLGPANARDAGTETAADLQYITEKDLVAVLKPVQARRLVAAWAQNQSPVAVSTSSSPLIICSSPASIPQSPASSSNTTSPARSPSFQWNWLETFQIPWQKLPEELVQQLERQKRPSPRLRREMRQDINKGMSIHELKEQWPLLFNDAGMAAHYKELVGKNLFQTFFDNVDKKEIIQMVLLLMAHFQEEEELLFHFVEDTCLAQEVQLDKLPMTPCIIVCGSSCFAARTFMLSVDSIVVNDHVTSFTSALCLMFGSFYCLTFTTLWNCAQLLSSFKGHILPNWSGRQIFCRMMFLKKIRGNFVTNKGK